MSKPLAITDTEFDQEVVKSTLPVIVDFWAVWCGPCKMIAPILEEVATEYNGKLKVVKIDVDANARVASQFGIMSIPTLLFFKDGKVVDQVIGAIPKAQLINRLGKIVG